MHIGMVGLGKMGSNMVGVLLKGGHDVAVFDLSADAVKAQAAAGARGASTLKDLVHMLPAPRTIWVMVPHGQATAQTLKELAGLCDSGDLVIDGGNSHFREDRDHAASLGEKGIHFVDVGVSGGVWGAELGYGMMVGGDPDDVARLKPALDTLAPPNGWVHCGDVGSGHFVKMVHNGIEYGMMEAYGEGFEILESSDFDLDLAAISEMWRHGTVIRSWLLDLAAAALKKDPTLAGTADYVPDTGEGRWTVIESIHQSVPAPVITLALQMRFRSRQESSFSAKIVQALRHEFGGHVTGEAGEIA